MTIRMIGLDEARRNLSGIVRGLDRGDARYLVSSRGRPKAVLLGVSDYLITLLRQRRARVIAEIQLEARSRGLDRLTLADINREIRAVRKARR